MSSSSPEQLSSKPLVSMANQLANMRSRSAFYLSLSLVFILTVKCQPSDETSKTSTPRTADTVTTTTDPLINSTGEVLLSGEEFVDFTEAPTLLFDGLAAESNHSTRQDQNNSSPLNDQVSNRTSGSLESTEPTSEDSSEDDDSETNDGQDEAKQSFEPPQNVSQYMDYIERLFHDLRHQIADLFEPHIPQLIRSSQMVQLSGSCSYDMLRMAMALRQFEPWALRMIDSSGKVPEGIFEGSFTALGSYDECLNTVFGPTAASQQQQPTANQEGPTQGKYCLVTVSPFLPPKPPADRVEHLFQEEANRRNYTKDDQFSRLSPMFYYIKFRIGVCIPSTCLDSDIESISSTLSSSLKLNITVPNCRVLQSQPLTRRQLVSGAIFALVLAVVLGATLIDYSRRKCDQLERQEIVMISEVACERTGEKDVIGDRRDQLVREASEGNFSDRLSKHWSWMSFSLLTNFKLYFKQATEDLGRPAGGSHNKLAPQVEPSPRREPTIIRCLNGIRVLSLCWVIIANSYITLDPRATKRLTKTREAPKDFLFQLIAQASLAIETFFFLSGVLLSLSFARRLRPAEPSADLRGQRGAGTDSAAKATERPSYPIRWIHFYVHRYVRMTPATMLIIAFSMFAYSYGDGPLWFEATHKSHQSCGQNWWRHLLHVANFIDTRQMCFIHYWYIAADMQLFLFAPILMLLMYQRRRIGYAVAMLIGAASIGSVFYTTYMRNLPPTLLFYNSDPESRREFGNVIMTKPLTHVLPYMVGMLLGKTLVGEAQQQQQRFSYGWEQRSTTALLGSVATVVALAEVFLPYKWNNSHLPTRFLASLYAALFRFAWALALAYLVMSCRHKKGKKCSSSARKPKSPNNVCSSCERQDISHWTSQRPALSGGHKGSTHISQDISQIDDMCMCAYGGNLVNRLLSLDIFTHLSKLSFVAYLIHLPLMSVFIGQTRGLFAFSHALVIHLALSYLVMTFILSLVLVHVIEFPFVTFERYLFEKLLYRNYYREAKQADESENANGDVTYQNRDKFSERL